MTQKARNLGFPYLEFGREYDPVKVQIKMPKKAAGQDKLGRLSGFDYGPFKEWTSTWVISVETDYRIWHFFIRHPYFGSVYQFDPNKVSVLFEAEPFFYLMVNASRKNKLNFFRHAVVESDDEVKAFLEKVVSSSELSDKDKRRAQTWVYRRAHKHGI